MMILYYERCPRLVPEDSVRLGTQTLTVLNRRKGYVGSFKYLIFILANLYNLFKKYKINYN